MAQGHADVADALLDSGDNLPLLPVLTLYREAMLWILAEDEACKRALSVALNTAPQSFLAGGNQEDVRLTRLRHILAMQAHLGPDNSTSQEQRHIAEMTRTSVRTMLSQQDGYTALPVRKILRRRRWRIGVLTVLVLAALAGLATLGSLLFNPMDLAQGKPWHSSSSLLAHFEAKVLFHTNEEMNPWFEIDLGRIESVRRLVIKNRPDCCFDRAVPLVAEVSADRSMWRQVARQELPFMVWEPRFPSIKARYIRLTVPRFSTLHLEQVRVY